MLDISLLNQAQREAVTATDGPLLVIAGAGSGKTRTIVYRLAWLIEQDHTPDSMLLLTFTRKAANEMLERASQLLEQRLMGLRGGTFHGFAFSVLRHYPPSWAEHGVTVMDSTDSAMAIRRCKESLGLAKGDRSFPRTQTLISLLSKARNKETPLEDLLHREAQHLLPYADDIMRIGGEYAAYRRRHALLDYDDLLFELESMMLERQDVLDNLRLRYRHLMVDEYQDTNRVQARLVRLLAGDPDVGGNVMAVGDDAQSIYAFRGATVHNILDFPKLFPGTRIVRLEENYRSVQPVLDMANAILANAPAGYSKNLFSRRAIPEESAVRLYHPLSDLTQGGLVARRIEELLERFPPSEIAVLFRAGYQSYHLEVDLNRKGIPFRKYGGLRYAEAAHIKDVMAYARLVLNPMDMPSFERLAGLTKGIGPKTAEKLYVMAALGNKEKLAKTGSRYPAFLEDLALIDKLRLPGLRPERIVNDIVDHYRPKLETAYPDDWPRRLQGLEEFQTIAAGYEDLGLFVADLALESPEDDQYEAEMNRITLSTVHSAKGLEWSAVLIIDLVEERFPSRHALVRPDDFEEERRLMYVACTRAKDSLDLFVPLSLYRRGSGGQEPAVPSPFVRELPLDDLEEIYESYGGYLNRRRAEKRAEAEQTAHGSVKGYLERATKDILDGSMFTPLPKKPFGDAARETEYDDNPFADDPFSAPAPRRTKKRGRPDPDDVYLASLKDGESERPPDNDGTPAPESLGYCIHRVFGRGKIVESLPPDKYRVNFPGLGLKVILAAYLSLEQN